MKARRIAVLAGLTIAACVSTVTIVLAASDPTDPTVDPAKQAIQERARQESIFKGKSPEEQSKMMQDIIAADAETVRQWVRDHSTTPDELTEAIQALPQVETNASVRTAPPASLSESGARARAAGTIIAGRVMGLRAQPNGAVDARVRADRQIDNGVDRVGGQEVALQLRASINASAGEVFLALAPGTALPPANGRVVVVADRLSSGLMPQPESGIYSVDAAGAVVPQAESPLRQAAAGLTVDGLVAKLRG